MLSSKQLHDIKQLQRLCEECDKIQLKLNWDMLNNRQEEKKYFFKYEKEELIAFLGVYGFGNKVELCGMVKPENRRQGVFTQLFSDALHVIETRNYHTVLLNAPGSSITAKGFLQSVPCTFNMTEYQMQWSKTDIADCQDVIVRASDAHDLEIEIQLDIQCFNFTRDEAVEFNHRIRKENKQDSYIIENDNQRVGKIRIDYSTGDAWIYSFAIFPEFQGNGIGRKALAKVVSDQHNKGYEVFLDVEAENSHALRLYESCGFKLYQSQDYYKYIEY
jgi:ribosomal protein S18 acetylase RimI-like enzyme